ncbi:Segregation and condensation protein A [Enhygromyxa salina]|uniref:Segregation and condensation protein A n=1 Tax=Enhygromyxa salina TaxID=215803 RepID=A0A0C1Z6A2_9BACT|nr:segregation/condensation protein A [Enhygromyxa salina]KIG13159.1 Segregation and condensation protein A [Enhygromyxa salina]
MGQSAGTSESPPPESAALSEAVPATPARVESERTKHERPATDSMADGVGSRTSYAIALDVFEGPLDLLLHLVRRHELDILDIPIAFITEKYIEYISLARSLDIEVAGEYLLMAATLAFLKSRELLPVIPSEDEDQDDEEDGIDPREELIRRLIEYERFRDAGLELSARPIAGRDVFPRGGDLSIEPPEPGLAPVTLFRLAEAYNRVLDRAILREDHEVVIEPITVRQRVQQLSVLLSDGNRVDFEALFLRQTWPSERSLRQMLVVTLMSVLEMVKLGILGVHQAQGSDAIELELTVDVAQMQQVVADFRGDDEEVAAALAQGAAPTETAAGGPAATHDVAVVASIVPEQADTSAEQGSAEQGSPEQLSAEQGSAELTSADGLEEASAEEAPADEASADGLEEASAEEAPADEASADGLEEASAEEAPADEASADGLEEASAEEAPADEASADGLEEASAEEAPADEASADEASADGLEEASAEEASADGLEEASADGLEEASAELTSADGLEEASAELTSADGLEEASAEEASADGLEEASAEEASAEPLEEASADGLEEASADGLEEASAEGASADGPDEASPDGLEEASAEEASPNGAPSGPDPASPDSGPPDAAPPVLDAAFETVEVTEASTTPAAEPDAEIEPDARIEADEPIATPGESESD